MNDSPQHRRGFRFSLRTMFAAVTVLAIVFAAVRLFGPGVLPAAAAGCLLLVIVFVNDGRRSANESPQRTALKFAALLFCSLLFLWLVSLAVPMLVMG